MGSRAANDRPREASASHAGALSALDPGASAPTELTSRLFAAMWAISLGLHAWHKGGSEIGQPLTDPRMIAVLLAAAWLIARPSSPHRLAILALVQVVVFAIEAPFVANHWTIAFFVNVGILVSYVAATRHGNEGWRG